MAYKKIIFLVFLFFGLSIMLHGCGCDDNQRNVFFRIEKSTIDASGYDLINTKIIKSKLMSEYTLKNRVSNNIYTLTIDEYETTTDCINTFNILLREKDSEFDLDNREIFDSEGNLYTLKIKNEKLNISNSYCIKKQFYSGEELKNEMVDCLFQNRRFIFLVETESFQKTSLKEIQEVSEMFNSQI